MKWNYIMDIQPEDGRSIVQIDREYMGHHTMGMRKYIQGCSFQEVLDFCKDNELLNPDFWWMYSEDFPFPDKNEKTHYNHSEEMRLEEIHFPDKIDK